MITINGDDLTLEQVHEVARKYENVSISKSAYER